ncbi:MAG: response regulator [Hyphomicrobiales bacterium]
MITYSDTTIIMLDDDEREVLLTQQLIKRSGIVNRFVSENSAGKLSATLDNLVAQGYDPEGFMLLLDINMPDMNGFDVLQEIRNNPKYKNITVIMLSSSDDAADILESMEVGSDGYLVKPFNGVEFFAAVENLPNVGKQLVQQPRAS